MQAKTEDQRKSDLKRSVAFQNAGRITRITNYMLKQEFKAELRRLKSD
jgi:hypothetical protein